MNVQSVRVFVIFDNCGVVEFSDNLPNHMATMLMFLIPLSAVDSYRDNNLRQSAPQQFSSCHVVAVDQMMFCEQGHFGGYSKPFCRRHDTSRTEKPSIRSMNPVEMSQSSSTS